MQRPGVLPPGFGKNGIVDLLPGLDRENIKPGIIGATSPAIVVGDTVVVGSALQLGTTPKSKENVPGYVRGYDVHTGKLLWTFHTIAQPGEFGNDTWKDGSWKYTGNTAVWAPMSADPELGYVYLPVETPTGDFYGGHRPGDDLFDESLVCVDARTGKRVWHFQIDSPWNLGLGQSGRAHPAGHHGQWTKDQSRRAGDQAGLRVRVRSRHRQAGLAHRRAAGAAIRRAGRKDLAHAAVPHQARGLRSPGRFARRFDRLHAGAESRSAEDRIAIQDGPDIHARHRLRLERKEGNADAAERHRRRQLAGSGGGS